MAIDIIASVIPNIAPQVKALKPKEDPDEYLYVHVYLTPRIGCSGVVPLEDFRHVFHWTEHLDYFGNGVTLTFRDPKNLGIPHSIPAASIQPVSAGYRCNGLKVTSDWKAEPADITQSDIPKWQKTIWRGMFGPDTPVDGWELDKNAYKLVTRLDLEALNSRMNAVILDAKDRLLSTPLAELGIPGIYDSEAAEDRMRRDLVAILDHLYDLSPDRKLNSPYLKPGANPIPFPTFLQQLVAALVGIDNERNQEIKDSLFKLTIDQVQERNTTEMNEFHKKMTAFANFPFLLKQTGWIWEYRFLRSVFTDLNLDPGDYFLEVSFQDPQAAINNAGTDEKKAQLTDFLDHVSFVSPLTAVSIKNDHSLDIRFKENVSYLPVTNGFIEAPTNDYPTRIDILEKNQVLDRMNDFLQKNYGFSYNNSQPLGSAAAQQKIQDLVNSKLSQDQGQIQAASQESAQLQKEKATQPVSSDYNSSGMSFHLQNLQKAVDSSVNVTPQSSYSNLSPAERQLLENANAIIYGHNLHKGYRPDVYWSAKDYPTPKDYGHSRPLCCRKVYYTIDFKEYKPGPDDEVVTGPGCIVDTDEGWVVESAQNSNSGNLYLDEELFRYNDWSLSADNLFRASDLQANTNEQTIANNSSIQIFSLPEEGSLPLLRFGRNYSIVLRFVDVVGGGRGPVCPKEYYTPDNVCANPQTANLPIPTSYPANTTNIRYRRTQGVGAPLLFLGEYLHQGGDRAQPYESRTLGQDLTTLVIRSVYDPNTKDLVFDVGSSAIRYVGPPKLDFHLVKKHGVFDGIMQEAANATVVNPGPAIQHTYQRLMTLTAQAELPPHPETVTYTKEAKIDSTREIDYLFDPLVIGYEVIVNARIDDPWYLRTASACPIKAGDPPFSPRSLDTTCGAPYFESVSYLRIQLAANDHPEVGTYQVLSGAGPAGELQKQIKLSMGAEQQLELKGLLLDRLQIATACEDKRLILSLDEMMYEKTIPVSSAQIKLIHAVQKPCLLYAARGRGAFRETYPATVGQVDRAPGDTNINLRFELPLFPCLTADSYVLRAVYSDITSCRNRFLPDGRTNDDGFYRTDVDKSIKTGFQPDQPGFEQGVVFSTLTHSFNDSKFRSVRYELQARSKFRKYFQETITDFTVTGDPQKDINILSANQPLALEIDRIVPLINWKGKVDGKDGVERVCDTIRIYFQGDWYSTGEGESVAVIFTDIPYAQRRWNGGAPFAQVTIPSSGYIPVPLENALSQFGLDPAIDYEGERTNMFHITRNFFDPSGNPPIISELQFGNQVCEPSPAKIPYQLKVKNLDFDGNVGNPYGDASVMAAIYQVHFMPPDKDEDLGRFFIDIRINPEDKLRHLYCPFLRFALARFQAHTVNAITCAPIDPRNPQQYGSAVGIDSRFSKIVLTDFVQMLPYRKIRIQGKQLLYSAPAQRWTPLEGPASLPPASRIMTNELCYIAGATSLTADKGLFSLDTGPQQLPDGTVTVMDPAGNGEYVLANDLLPDPAFVIEEYEQYYSPETVAVDQPVRNDFRKRLILSYVHPKK